MKTKVLASQIALVLGTTLAGPAAVSVQAQESLALEEVIVTARKREESLMEIPVSVAVIDESVIQDANLNDINDLANITPGLKYNTAFGRQGDRPVIRGLSSIFTSTELAGFFVDGIYVAGSLQTFDLSAMERVEVLKGPQSAVFGRRTFSGAINYVTARPTEDFSGKVELSAGENGYQVLTGMISDTIGDFGYRINARTYDYDGDFDNTKSNGPSDIGGQSADSINGNFRWDISDATVLTFNAMYAETDDEHFAMQLHPSSQNNCEFEGREYYCGEIPADTPIALGGVLKPSDYGIESENMRTSFRLEHNFDFADFSWTTAYNTYDNTAGMDESWKGAEIAFDFSIFFFSEEAARDWHTISDEETEDWSHEAWLRGLAMDDRLSWSVGAYYYDEESDGTATNGYYIQYRVTEDEVTNTAFMGALEYDFTDTITAGLEVRYAEDEITENTDGVEFNDTWESTTYRLTGSWNMTDDTMFYGSWSTGVLPGGFNADLDLPASLQSIDEQELEQIELGVKSTLTDSLSLTAAIYTMEWEDQVRSEFYDGTSPPSGYQANQGTSDIEGVEVDLNWQALDSLLLTAGVSYNDTEVKDFVSTDATDIAITGDGDVSGNQMPLSPETEVHVSGTHNWNFDNGMMLTTRLDASYQDSRYVRVVNVAETGSETLVNLSVALSGESWRVAVWGKNLTDEDSAVSILRYLEADSFFYGGRAFAVTPRPGTEWGVTASYNF